MSDPPFKVKAVYEYSSPHEDDLHFPAGQIITVTELEDDDWYAGEYVDSSDVKQEGIFPRNFVEKYEPTAPPRPTRSSRPKKEVEPAVEPAPAPPQPVEPAHEEEPEPEPEPEAEPEPEPQSEPEVEPEPVPEPLPVRAAPPPAPAPKAEPAVAPPPAQAADAPPAVPKAAPAPPKPAAPPVSEKPSGGSFRDRIAAFNKAAPPVAPFKPSGLGSGGSSNFIKKPFVAPPPSKNAYIPPPREPVPQKVYRRDEDPEIAAKESENLEQAEKAGLAATSNEEGAEEQPKPTSLKERIALLQKQQMEQAARHAEAAQKKEKPKRPSKKRVESHTEGSEETPGAVPERRDTEESSARPSVDSAREEPSAPRRRKSSKAGPTTPGLHPRKSFGDGNDADMSGAGDTTEEPEEISTGRDDSDEKPRTRGPPPPARAPSGLTRGDEEAPTGGSRDEEAADDQEDEDEEDEDEEDVDPEVRRKEELRARMAKMSGGMGMHGIFGGMPMPGPSAPPKKKKSTGTSEKRSGEYGVEDAPSAATHAPPVPMIPLPGLSRVRSPEDINRQTEHEHEDDASPTITSRPADEVPDVEEVVPSHERAPPPVPAHAPDNAPPIPSGRPAPPPVPTESRPNAPQLTALSPSAGSESDDEMSASAERQSLATPKAEAPRPPGRPESQISPRSPTAKGTSYFGSEETLATSPIDQGNNRRASRVPPIPGAPTVVPTQSRAPPPPPPGGTLSRSSTGDKDVPTPPSLPTKVESEEEVTEYEGDYDTDIASAVPHKDALKAHAREPSIEDTNSIQPPVTMPPSAPPPLPATAAPRSIPPPLPSQPPPNARQSAEMPRAAPPPPPPPKMPAPWEQEDDEYDPFKYTAPKQGVATATAPSSSRVEQREEVPYSNSPPRHQAPPPQDRQPPPPPPREAGPGPGTLNRGQSRQSLDVPRSSTAGRRSVELSRISMDTGYVANDVDLGRSTYWWTQPRGIPPVFHNRRDILHEVEESSSKEGGKSTFTREVYVLYQDYSQTVITAQFDAQNPADVNLEQRHDPPPSRLRQDQLEQAHELFGRRIAEVVTSKQGTVIGDGSPQSLVQELLKPLSDALPPVGIRAYGSVVYANLANASTQQNDEIRPGDIITLRNTKFQGKHGPMHAKYSAEVGKPDHVGIVAEWDGTKKKVRAWEQGRESKKVKMESFKLDDMRSGEVKIWRVMPRSWVGWQGHN